MRLQPVAAIICILILSCSQKQKADLLVFNAVIYTVDSSFSVAEAMVINNGKITATGKQADLENEYDTRERMDAAGKFIYPG
jgi:predicted amidohydrolase YtcJ